MDFLYKVTHTLRFECPHKLLSDISIIDSNTARHSNDEACGRHTLCLENYNRSRTYHSSPTIRSQSVSPRTSTPDQAPHEQVSQHLGPARRRLREVVQARRKNPSVCVPCRMRHSSDIDLCTTDLIDIQEVQRYEDISEKYLLDIQQYIKLIQLAECLTPSRVGGNIVGTTTNSPSKLYILQFASFCHQLRRSPW